MRTGVVFEAYRLRMLSRDFVEDTRGASDEGVESVRGVAFISPDDGRGSESKINTKTITAMIAHIGRSGLGVFIYTVVYLRWKKTFSTGILQSMDSPLTLENIHHRIREAADRL